MPGLSTRTQDDTRRRDSLHPTIRRRDRTCDLRCRGRLGHLLQGCTLIGDPHLDGDHSWGSDSGVFRDSVWLFSSLSEQKSRSLEPVRPKDPVCQGRGRVDTRHPGPLRHPRINDHTQGKDKTQCAHTPERDTTSTMSPGTSTPRFVRLQTQTASREPPTRNRTRVTTPVTS